MTDEGTCPKEMRFGPCGGARADGRCELGDRTCPFVAPGHRWQAPAVTAASAAHAGTAFVAPRVLVDVREPTGVGHDPRRLWRDLAAVLEGATALVGEHADHVDGAARPAVPEVVHLLAAGGVRTVATLTGRERSRESIRDDAVALGRAGVLAVHCVTGDHPRALGVDRSPRWGGECFDIIRACVAAGVTACAAESPASPGPRVERVLAKARSGAAMVVLNHAGDAHRLIDFARRCRDAGVSIPLLAPVPVVVEPRSAARLDRFPGLELPSGLTAAVANAARPRAEGIARAVAIADDLLASGEFAGVNLSGPAGMASAGERLAVTADLLDALHA